MSQLRVFNSLTGDKELFTPLHEGHVGMYVCGPTLYSEPHMGNMRTFINFDLIYRYLLYRGYSVKYVRNITDAGHITNSAGNTEDTIGKAARLEQVQPLEIVYKYNVVFQELQRIYNLLPPSIEPTATQHIQEQIEIIEQIIENGFAYVENGSVYFDVKKYAESYEYGVLSGRKLDELMQETRDLNAQGEKRFFADFALWKKANPEDMQIWRSPWGDGNPGWHIECTAMSTKYLGKQFDIHGGGMDLKFPHHEDEIAQSCGSMGCNPARYWLHANMLNVNGQKMSKSFGNYFLPKDILEGTTGVFEQSYSANTVRLLMMQAHYRSTMDMSEASLQNAEKAVAKFLEVSKDLPSLAVGSSSSWNAQAWKANCISAMDDDFNTPQLIAQLFEASKVVNSVKDGKMSLTQEDKDLLEETFNQFLFGVLGIQEEHSAGDNRLSPVMDLVLDLRKQARENKDWGTSDKIRDMLQSAGIVVKDGKEGSSWQ